MSISVQIKGDVARKENVWQGFISNTLDQEKWKPKTTAWGKQSKVKTKIVKIYDMSNETLEKKIFSKGLCKTLQG